MSGIPHYLSRATGGLMCLLLAVAVGCGPSSKRPGSDAKLPVEPPVQAQSNSAAKPGLAPRSGVAFDLEATRAATLGGAAIAQIALADDSTRIIMGRD